MASQSQKPQSLYPQVLQSNPESHSPFLSTPTPSAPPLYPSLNPLFPDPNPTPSSMYPSIHMSDLVENLFPDSDDTAPTIEETLIHIPGAILHLIDKHRSVELACGDLSVTRLSHGDSTVAVLARVTSVQWPLSRDSAAVKLDESHYFFSLSVPEGPDGLADLLNYGLTFASKGQEALLKDFEGILGSYTSFSVQMVSGNAESEVLDGSVEKEVTPAEVMGEGAKKEMMEERSTAYWTTLAPNVEDYGSLAAKGIAMGSGQLVRGILWCGDVTVDRLKWGNDMLKKKMGPSCNQTDISPEAIKRMERYDL